MQPVDPLAEYAARRDDLLRRITAKLEADPRFQAAWLLGSLGRGEGDAFSDLDLAIVVEDDAAAELCAVNRAVYAGAPEARLALFQTFGEPLNIHENHRNAPLGGTFSAVLYRDPPVMVDWGLVPRRAARRAGDTRLLFARAEIPAGAIPPAGDAVEVGPPLTPAEQRAERTAFFWMMAAVAAKYIARAHLAEARGLPDRRAQQNVEWVLPFLAGEIAGVLGGQPELPAASTPAGRLRLLCDQMELEQGERAPARAAVETILGLS